MDRDTIIKLSKHVGREFPEMVGVRPSVKRDTKSPNGLRYVLTFKGDAELPGGKTMRRIVRVITDEKGRILRMSTSK
ncbi:MAG: hypothetical protein GTO14_15175 [Anaerolineales bacterium]|nr:hypothetical protein [Anaerolineales bacterium]